MAAAAATLPNDLIIDILSRAPAWSVCQFRCVSKEWRVLIADPAFAAEHGSRHAAEPYVVATHLRGNYSSGIVQDLQMLDMEGNVMRTIKGAGGSGLISPSVGDLICIADSFKNPDASCRVVDLVTRNVAAECPKLHVEPHHRWARYNIFGFGRAVTEHDDVLLCSTLRARSGRRQSKARRQEQMAES